MIAVEMEDEGNAACTAHVQKELMRNGFIVAQRPGLNVLRIDPGLTIEKRDVECFLEALGKVLMQNRKTAANADCRNH